MDEPGGVGDLHGIYEARRRIAAAFEEITAGSEALAQRVAEAPDTAEFDRLRAAVEEERTANAQLAERVRSLRERGSERGDDRGRVAELEQSLARAREEAAHLEARRVADRAELDAVLTELIPLIEEAR